MPSKELAITFLNTITGYKKEQCGDCSKLECVLGGTMCRLGHENFQIGSTIPLRNRGATVIPDSCPNKFKNG